jgi:hypothetical protein
MDTIYKIIVTCVIFQDKIMEDEKDNTWNFSFDKQT